MVYILSCVIALTTLNLGLVVFLIVMRKEEPDGVVMGQQLQALKLGVTDLSERLDVLYKKDRTLAARAAKNKDGEQPQTPLELDHPIRRTKEQLRAAAKLRAIR